MQESTTIQALNLIAQVIVYTERHARRRIGVGTLLEETQQTSRLNQRYRN